MRFSVAVWLAIALASPLSGASRDADLERQLAALRRTQSGVFPGTREAKTVATRLAEIGRRYLDLGENGRALELLEEAYGLDDENGLLLAELTLAHVRAEDFPSARFYLELAEQRAPRAPPTVYAVLGETYYTLNRLEDAVLAWEQFARLGGADARVLGRLARARQELSLSSRQKFLEIGDFAFFFDAAIPREMVERVAARLSESYREQADFFGLRLPATQVVVLYAGRAYFTLVSVPEWVSGVFDGKIRVAVDPNGGITPQLESVMSHELAHSLIRHVSGDRAPGWLHEGLAQWWEGRRVLRGEFRELLRGSGPVSLSALETNLARKADRAAARSNYVEALGVVEYLMLTRGPGALACIVRDFGEGDIPEAALAKETGLSSAELVSRWRAWAGI
ncbi:MAG: hypothetical protein ABR610_10200 [Thermoanaerobaculia bacterium]